MIAALAETRDKHAERWRAQDRERPLLKLGRSDNRRRRARHNTLLVWRCLPAVVCGSLCFSESELCRRVPRRMYVYTVHPEVTGTGLVCVCVPKPQQHQHRTTTPAAAAVASRRWSRVLAPQRANPTLAVGRTCNVSSKFTQQEYSVRKCNTLL